MIESSKKVSQLGDKAIAEDIRSRFFLSQGRRVPFLISFIRYTLKSFFSIGAFLPRAILRAKLGERTYGVATLVMVYLVLCFIQISQVSLMNFYNEHKDDIEKYNGSLGKLKPEEVLIGLAVFLAIPSKEREELSELLPAIYISTFAYVYGDQLLHFSGLENAFKNLWYIILALTISHYVEMFLRKRRGEVIDSRYRGKSLLFSFLVGRSIFGIKITQYTVWMILEPILVYGLAVAINSWGYYTIGLFFKITAVFLLLEEYIVYSDHRSLSFDIADSILQGKKIAIIQKEYEERIREYNSFQNNSRDTNGSSNPVSID